MNKNDAMMRLSAIKREAEELEKIISAPDVAPSLLGKPVPMSEAEYWCLTRVDDVGLRSFKAVKLVSTICKRPVGGNIFTDQTTAEAYAKAIDTLLLLRHQPGTVAAIHGKAQYVIEPVEGVSMAPSIYSWSDIDTKGARLSPCFATRKAAQAALDAVGADRIERMWKTLHHIKD